MFGAIFKNKIKTGVIVSLFILMITSIVYYICIELDLGNYSIMIALMFSFLSAWSSYYFSDRIVLSMNGARPATQDESIRLMDILDNLMPSTGLQYKPRLYVIESSQPNAFATGRNPKHAVVCVTTGLLSRLDYYELEGVIAHELSHIKNYDIMLSAVVTVMVGFIVMISDFFIRMSFTRRNTSNRKNESSGNAIIAILGLLSIIIGPILAQLMKLALSRKREFLADATSVKFTGNPDGLISALQKIDSDNTEYYKANNATSYMFIVNPFKKSANGRKSAISLLSTHPSIESRIKALSKLK